MVKGHGEIPDGESCIIIAGDVKDPPMTAGVVEFDIRDADGWENPPIGNARRGPPMGAFSQDTRQSVATNRCC